MIKFVKFQETICLNVTPVDVYDFAHEILVKNPDKSRDIWDSLYRKRKKDWRSKDLEYFGNLK